MICDWAGGVLWLPVRSGRRALSSVIVADNGRVSHRTNKSKQRCGCHRRDTAHIGVFWPYCQASQQALACTRTLSFSARRPNYQPPVTLSACPPIIQVPASPNIPLPHTPTHPATTNPRQTTTTSSTNTPPPTATNPTRPTRWTLVTVANLPILCQCPRTRTTPQETLRALTVMVGIHRTGSIPRR